LRSSSTSTIARRGRLRRERRPARGPCAQDDRIGAHRLGQPIAGVLITVELDQRHAWPKRASVRPALTASS
jgi:hypothetical protein